MSERYCETKLRLVIFLVPPENSAASVRVEGVHLQNSLPLRGRRNGARERIGVVLRMMA